MADLTYEEAIDLANQAREIGEHDLEVVALQKAEELKGNQSVMKKVAEWGRGQVESLSNFPDPLALKDEMPDEKAMAGVLNTAAGMSFPASSLATPLRRIALGAASGAGSPVNETWQDKLTGALGGATMAGAFETIPVAHGIMSSAKKTFYDPAFSGEKVVGQTLNRLASDPNNEAVLKNTVRSLFDETRGLPEQFVRGSNPTTPQASRNGGLWALYKAVMAREPAADRAITDAQNVARLKAFKELGGGVKEVGEQAATGSFIPGGRLKDAAVADLAASDRALAGTPIDLQNTLNTVDELLASGAAKTPQIRSQLQSIRRNLFSDAEAAPEVAIQAMARKPQVIDYEKDDLIAAIRKLGGINKESAQRIHGNKLWEDTVNTPNPRLGPVWRNGQAGQSLDDIAARLHEHGYLMEPDPKELVETLYHHGQGTIDAASMFSNRKGDWSEFDVPRNEQDALIDRVDRLAQMLERKAQPKAEQTSKPLETTIDQVQGIRTAINRAVYGENGLKVAGPIGEQLSGISGKLTGTIDDAIGEALSASGNEQLHRAFLNKYAQGSKLEQRARLLKELQTKGSSPGELPVIGETAPGQYGPTGEWQAGDIMSVKLSNALRGKDKGVAELKRILTPNQMERIENIDKDIRRAIPRDVKRGSDTFQNLAVDYILSDILGPTGAANTAVGGLAKGALSYAGKAMPGFVQKAIPSANVLENDNLRQMLVKAMENPRYAQYLMENAPKTGLISLGSSPSRAIPGLEQYMADKDNQRLQTLIDALR